MTRTALLIGVTSTPDPHRFAPLDEPVSADLQGMREALESSGYQVEVLRDAGRAQIGAKIFELAGEVPEDGTFLVYFTGHGVRLDTDYLLPADARVPPDGEWAQVYRDSLLPADISPYLTRFKGATVLWLIDACREVLDETAFDARIVQGPPVGGFVRLVGCDRGEKCGYAPEGSFFTRGLIEAFSSLSTPQTVHAVFEATRATTARLAAKHGGTQSVQIRYGQEQEDLTGATRICEGRHLMDEWRAVITNDDLWALTSAPSDRLQECLLSLVETCARHVQNAGDRLPDPWTDDDFAPRLLRTLPLIVSRNAGLSQVEVATLIAAVFLHEAAWADRVSQAADTDPLTAGRQPGAGPLRRHLEQVHDQHSHIARKLTELALKPDFEACGDVGLWLVHRWIAERFETDEKPVQPALVTGFASAVLGCADAGRVSEFADTLTRLAAGVGTDPPLDGPTEAESRNVQLREGSQSLRERPLAALLRLAGVLAVDVRTLPDVIAEHLGVSDRVRPKDVVALVQESVRWPADNVGLHMDVLCPHQAMHAALEEVAERADRLVAQTRALDDRLPRPEARLLKGIPERVTARDLRPQQSGGQKRYDVPLLRFRLAQTEVRELLMGRQLYGSPDLALRELYQNAMDACRYREMRWKYLRAKGGQPAQWEGRISITQGEDDRGRYVECRDNGVGMGREQLTNTFTRAGSRFEQSRLFRQEQAAWLRHDPELRLYPNSRFGIGVFSYFMLADEMTIVTRAVSRDGVPAQEALRVEISSSGSLFRIHPDTEPGDSVPEGGTRIRLYLRDDADLRDLSCARTLGALIAVSEFHVHVSDFAAEPVEWQPGKLYELRAHEGRSPHEAVEGVLWWVDGKGVVLCDGIATNVTPWGCVLNLTGAHAGTLSVNRKELQSYDKEWAELNWRKGVPGLLRWPSLTMNWLWNLDASNLAVARVLWQEVRGTGAEAPWEGSLSYNLDVVGILFTDGNAKLPDIERLPTVPQSDLRPWRSTVLGRVSRWQTSPKSLIGYPVPQPGDAGICFQSKGQLLRSRNRRELWWSSQDWTTTVEVAHEREMTVSEVVRGLRRLRIVHPLSAPPRVEEGDLDWWPDAMVNSILDELVGGDAGRQMDGVDDIRGLVAASCRLREPLGALVEQCARFAPLRRSPLPEVPSHHQNYICTTDDLAMLYIQDPDQYERSARPVAHPADVRAVAQMFNLGHQAVLDRLAQFSWLGFAVPDADEVDAWMRLSPATSEVLRQIAYQGQTLAWAATIILAAKQRVPLSKAENELIEVADTLGLRYAPRLGRESAVVDLIPSQATSELVAHAHRSGADVLLGLRLSELAAHMPIEINHLKYLQIMDELRKMGIPVPDDIRLLTEWKNLPVRVRQAFTGREPSLGAAYRPSAPTTAGLFAASAELMESLGDIWHLAEGYAAGLALSMPSLPEGLTALRPTLPQVKALVSGGRFGDAASRSWTPVSIDRLAEYALETELDARAAYERLTALKPLGALVPELSREALEGLAESRPDDMDVVALKGEHRVTKPGEPLVALDLVSIAARLGEAISETWQRFVPYLPLAPEPKVSVFPDEIPRWQDLAILSKYLDGLLPAIEGRVDPAHVAFVAREVDESERWVWDRLKLYAEMFELDLSDMPGDGE